MKPPGGGLRAWVVGGAAWFVFHTSTFVPIDPPLTTARSRAIMRPSAVSIEISSGSYLWDDGRVASIAPSYLRQG